MTSPLGITPNSDGRVVRLSVPALSGERRLQLAQQIKGMAEQARVSIRNSRRDANKHTDQLQKSKEISEDQRDDAKIDADELTKKYTTEIDKLLEAKTTEVMEV